MSDFLWYMRLLVWVGCGALLLEALAGKSFGYLTLVAVIFLVLGFVGFLGALALEGAPPSWLAVPADTPESAAVERGQEPLERVGPPAQARQPLAVSGLRVPAESHAPEHQAVSPRAAIVGASVSKSPRSVRTEELDPASASIGSACPFCGRELRAGQLGARCWACQATHHAGCWTENRFHCATPGCVGAGSLEAPETEGNSSPP
jgi:hypothetical protein